NFSRIIHLANIRHEDSDLVLYEIAELHDLYYIPLKSLESSDNKSYNNYKEAISYVGKLERLDYLCDLDKFDHKDDFHNYG
ncbi:hypothetical protein, partial [Spirosoma litoris]